jgi:biopolymer transport protein ExbD
LAAQQVQSDPNRVSATEAPWQTRIRRRRARKGAPIAVNLAPMVDMSFLLLIFFLVTTSFERAEGLLSSKLPEDTGASSPVALPLTPIVIRLAPSATPADSCSIEIDRFDNVPQTFAALSPYLADILLQPGFDDQTPVVIMADDDVSWNDVVDCWNAAVAAGCRKLVFGQRQH